MPEVIIHVFVSARDEDIEAAVQRIRSIFVEGVVIIPDPLPPPARPPLQLPPRGKQGVDVAHWQVGLRLASVKEAGKDFVMIKATDGETGVDSQAARFYQEAGEAGLLRGFYHYFRPDASAEGQAAHFTRRVMVITGGVWGELVPAVDIEIGASLGPEECARRLLVMLNVVKDACGYRPMLYAGSYFMDDNVAKLDGLQGEWPLWIAHYTSKPAPRLPSGWSNWVLWQYSKTGRVAGHEGNIDLDRRSPA